MLQKALVDFDISDFDKEPVRPTSPAMRRSSRIQTQDSPWAQWPSEKIITALESVSIPFTVKCHEKISFFCPSDLTSFIPTPSVQPKQTSGKQTAKSSSP